MVKILCDFAISTVAYFFIGYSFAYEVNFLTGAEALAGKSGYELVKFFFLLTFAAAVPAIVSGGIAERAKFNPQLAATFLLVGFVYPFFESIAWNDKYGVQAWLEAGAGAKFHDFAGSVVVHAVGGWIGLMAVLLLGARRGRYTKGGGIAAGIFGLKSMGGLGGVTFMAQLAGTLLGIGVAVVGGLLVYGVLKQAVGIRLDQEDEFQGSDLSIHKIGATPEREANW
ncbi:MAG: hypothetical protein HY525_03365 [Betaproteobacteria bacterium]|nr:hypothetical protein [Betaproteobacteria bacterium]